MTDDLIDAAYLAWVVASCWVVALVLPVIWRRVKARDFDREFWFALGIFLSWFGGGVLIRGWFLAWREGMRHGVDTSWMLHHPAIVIGSVVVICGALLHVSSFAARRSTMIWAAGSVAAAFAGHLLFI